MEYMHAVLLLHSAGKEITEEAIEKIISAAGLEPDSNKIKALIASLDGVDIDEAIKTAAVAAPAAAGAAPAAASEAPAAEEKKEEEEEDEEEEIGGLASLFG